MIAQRYNGTVVKGTQVVDFVIWNEVNSWPWFNVGCGQGVPCDTTTWVSVSRPHPLALSPHASFRSLVFYSLLPVPFTVG